MADIEFVVSNNRITDAAERKKRRTFRKDNVVRHETLGRCTVLAIDGGKLELRDARGKTHLVDTGKHKLKLIQERDPFDVQHNIEKGDVVVHADHGKCTVRKLSKSRAKIKAEDGKTHIVALHSLKIAPLDRESPYDQDKEQDIWSQIRRRCGWHKAPKVFWKILSLEEEAFLNFLIEWSQYTTKEHLAKRNGWFYCSNEQMLERRGISEESRKRLLRSLAKKNLIACRRESRKVGDSFQTRRVIRIHCRMILALLPAAKEPEHAPQPLSKPNPKPKPKPESPPKRFDEAAWAELMDNS